MQRTASRKRAPRQGQGTLWLRNNFAYEGYIEVTNAFVHFEGHRRVGYRDEVTYRPAGAITWAAREVRVIRWAEGAST